MVIASIHCQRTEAAVKRYSSFTRGLTDHLRRYKHHKLNLAVGTSLIHVTAVYRLCTFTQCDMLVCIWNKLFVK